MMKGLKAEDKVAASLRRAGGHVEQSPGSKGSADIVSTWDSGKKWFTQVKSSNTKTPADLSSREKANLVRRADNNNGVPVLAQVSKSKISYSSVKSGRALKP
ncbi:MAG: hypothetical protein ABH819_03645 [Patescibacteria group bacterium]